MTAGRKSTYNKSDWNTPTKYVDAVLQVFDKIDLDPCSNKESIVPARTKYILPENNGLKETWDFPRIYVNPPYGKQSNKTSIYNWLEKCFFANQDGSEVIALIPVATNTSHWKEFIFKADAICFLYDTRLIFRINGNENNKGAPMACAMIYWGGCLERFVGIFKNYGNCVKAI